MLNCCVSAAGDVLMNLSHEASFGSRYNRAGGLEGGMLREIPTLGANPVPAAEVCEEGERAAPSPPRWKIRERGLHGAEGCDRGRPCGT